MSDAARALEAIRLKELETASRLEQAHLEAQRAVGAARREATDAVTAARTRGREEAQRRFEASVAAAEQEARAILAGCDEREAALREAAAPLRDAAVVAMIDLLLAPPLEEGK